MAQMGGVPVVAAQPMMYNQPVLRATNPFTPMPGAQVSRLPTTPQSDPLKERLTPPPHLLCLQMQFM